jgi:hypothetical protein
VNHRINCDYDYNIAPDKRAPSNLWIKMLKIEISGTGVDKLKKNLTGKSVLCTFMQAIP